MYGPRLITKETQLNYPGINDELFHSCSRLLQSSSWWQVKRANHLKGKMNNLSEGASRRKFFQQSWTLAVSKGKIVPQLWRAVRVMPGSLWSSCRLLQVSSTVQSTREIALTTSHKGQSWRLEKKDGILNWCGQMLKCLMPLIGFWVSAKH